MNKEDVQVSVHFLPNKHIKERKSERQLERQWTKRWTLVSLQSKITHLSDFPKGSMFYFLFFDYCVFSSFARALTGLQRVPFMTLDTVSLGSKSDTRQRPPFSQRLISVMLRDFVAAQCRHFHTLTTVFVSPRRVTRATETCAALHAGLQGGGKSSGLVGMCWARIQTDGPSSRVSWEPRRIATARPGLGFDELDGWRLNHTSSQASAGTRSLEFPPTTDCEGEVTDTWLAMMKTSPILF